MKKWLLEKRWRILLAGFLTVALPLVCLTIYVYLQVISQFRRIGFEENQIFFNLAVYHVEEKINADIANGKIFAASPELIEAIRRNDVSTIRAFLNNFIHGSDTIERIVVTTPKAVAICDYPEIPQVAGMDFSFRDWYKGVSTSWEPYVSDFFLREAPPRRYLFVIAIPVKDRRGASIGVLALQPKKNYLKDVLENIRIGKSFIYAVDKRGDLIYHPQYQLDKGVNFSKVPAVDKVKRGIAGTEEGIDGTRGEPIISTFRPMKWGWGLVMQRPEREVFQRAREIAAGLFILAAAFLVLGGIVAYKGAGLLFSSHRLSMELRDKEIYERETKERLKTELDMRTRTERRLVRAMADLERSNKELEQFAYVASHDLQEPLRKITSFIELIERQYKDKPDPDVQRYIKYVVDGAKRMQTLINDLLSYSRLGSRGKEFLTVDLNKALDRVLSDMQKSIKDNGAEVTFDKLPVLMADDAQIGQVFQNLIGNAIKFRGGDVPRIHVSARHEGEGWTFAVSDNGIGIEPAFYDRIFFMFQRLHTQAEYPGTGIGLAVCKKIVERHGGRIWVESETGKGTTFYFTIPERQGGNE